MFLESLVEPAMHIGIADTTCACLQPTPMVLLPLYCSLCARLFYVFHRFWGTSETRTAPSILRLPTSCAGLHVEVLLLS